MGETDEKSEVEMETDEKSEVEMEKGKNNAMEGIVDKKASAAISLTSKESGISELNGDSDVINKAIEDHLQEKENIEAVTKEPGEVEEELNEEEIDDLLADSPKREDTSQNGKDDFAEKATDDSTEKVIENPTEKGELEVTNGGKEAATEKESENGDKEVEFKTNGHSLAESSIDEELEPMSKSPKEIPDKTDEAVLDDEKENGEHSEDKEETKEKSEDVMETEEKSEVEMETDEKSEVEMETDEKSEVE